LSCQHRCRVDLRARELAEKTSASALSKEVDVVKTLQAEMVSLSRSLDDELSLAKEKDGVLKWKAELENEMANLRSLAASTKDEMKKAKGLQSLYDVKRTELSELN
jgi:hypothetical protein